jgi:DNA-binding NtrC family response regulator
MHRSESGKAEKYLCDLDLDLDLATMNAFKTKGSFLLNRFQKNIKTLARSKSNSKRLLVVDDEQCLREGFSHLFKMAGAETFEAENAEKAYEILKSVKIDILVSDVRMPGESGIALIKRINSELHYKPKMFLCSGFSDIAESESLSLGVLSVFPKPFNFEEMLQTVLGRSLHVDLTK